MKNILYFLLGFFIVLAIAIRSHATQADIHQNRCYYYWITHPHTTYTGTASSVTTYTVHDTVPLSATFVNTASYTGTSVWDASLKIYYWDYNLSAWNVGSNYSPARMTQNTWNSFLLYAGDAAVTFQPNLTWPNGPTDGSCRIGQECPDTDNDGLCDACDDDPEDSNIGADLYLKGYYEYDGETVATLRSYKSENSSYDHLTLAIDRKNASFPGLIIGLGMPSSISESDFASGGGKFIAFVEPEKILTKKCRQVESTEDCTDTICEIQDPNQSVLDRSTDPLNDEAIKPSTEQKQDDHKLLNPEVPESTRQQDCAQSCGGTINIKQFAFVQKSSGGGYFYCECTNGGVLSLLENFNQDLQGKDPNQADLDEINEQLTGTGTGTITGGLGGSLIDSDQDGHIDGYQQGDGTVDFSPLIRSYGQLKERFPFSLVYAIQTYAEQFYAPPQAPSFDFKIGGKTLVINLSFMDPVANFVRSMLAFLFVIMAIWAILKIFGV